MVSAELFQITAEELSLVLNPQGTFSMFQATLNPWASLGVHNPMCCRRDTGRLLAPSVNRGQSVFSQQMIDWILALYCRLGESIMMPLQVT